MATLTTIKNQPLAVQQAGKIASAPLASSKYHFEQYRGLDVAFTRPAFLTSAVKNSLIAVNTILSNKELKKDFSNNALRLFSRLLVVDLSILTVKSFLQRFALTSLSPRTASKFIKGMASSALRKSARHGSAGVAAVKIARSAVLGHTFTHLAIFLVEQSVDTYAYYKSLDQNGDSQAEKSKFVFKTDKNLTRLFGSIALAAVCSAVGTLIKPGTGTLVGGLLGDTIFYLF